MTKLSNLKHIGRKTEKVKTGFENMEILIQLYLYVTLLYRQKHPTEHIQKTLLDYSTVEHHAKNCLAIL